MPAPADPASAARRVAAVFERWSRPDHVRLHAGEMTAQEMRSVRAVLGAVRREVEAAVADAKAEAAGQASSSERHAALAAAGMPVEAVAPIDGASVGRALRQLMLEHPDRAEQAQAMPRMREWFVSRVMAACRGLPRPEFVHEIVEAVFAPPSTRP